MAGCQTFHLRGGRIAAVLAVSIFAFAGRAGRRTRLHHCRRPDCQPRVLMILSVTSIRWSRHANGGARTHLFR